MSGLFDTSDFPARWNCGEWSAAHGWTHIVADFAIFGAYAAIPVVLAYFVNRRRDVPFLPIFWLFVGFILLCGIGHFVEATIFWQPWYRLSAAIKVCTAIVSWATVIALLPILPRALNFPGLVAINKQLKSEVSERQAAEGKLREAYGDLQSFTNNVLDREDRIIELKREVNELLQLLGREARYAPAVDDGRN